MRENDIDKLSKDLDILSVMIEEEKKMLKTLENEYIQKMKQLEQLRIEELASLISKKHLNFYEIKNIIMTQ